MTAYPAWTPASRPGIIPLHPLSFGTILGRSFAALRQNPRVLLGFALVVQTAAYLLVIVAAGGLGILAFTRLDTVPAGSEDFDQIMAGSIALTIVAGFVLGLAAGAIGVLVQGVVVTEVAHAAVAEKLTLRRLWQQVRPSAWRLIGYTLLLGLAVLVLMAVIVGLLVAIGVAIPALGIGLGVLVVLAAIPLTLWLSTKLLLVPAAIILERATIREALGRSWTLIRGRFWPALGIVVILAVIFGTIGQVVNVPFALLSSGLTAIIAPTGSADATALIATVVTLLLSQVVTLLVQAVAVVVQSTATSIIYIDCRMRREGLDLDLLAYVERRDAGAADLPDPYRQGIGRAFARPMPAAGPYAAGPYAPGPPPGYDPRYAGAYSGGPAPAARPAYPQPPAYGAAPPYPAAGPYPAAAAHPAAPPPPHAAPPPGPPAPPADPGAASASADDADASAAGERAPESTRWAAPGDDEGGAWR